MKRKDYNKLVKIISKLEGKKSETSVGNVREVLATLKKLDFSGRLLLVRYLCS